MNKPRTMDESTVMISIEGPLVQNLGTTAEGYGSNNEPMPLLEYTRIDGRLWVTIGYDKHGNTYSAPVGQAKFVGGTE